MPLFDSLEGDVTAFFVSQGSVFDSLVKSFMERMALVESRVELLRSDVSQNFQSVYERIDSSRVAAAEAAAAAAATAADAAATAAAAAVAANPQSSLPVVEYTPPMATVVADSGRNEEHEYYTMTLSRQLNMVLELLFQPHAHDAVEVVHAKQTQLHSISDVLTENESILMQLAAQSVSQEDHNDDAIQMSQPPPLEATLSTTNLPRKESEEVSDRKGSEIKRSSSDEQEPIATPPPATDTTATAQMKAAESKEVAADLVPPTGQQAGIAESPVGSVHSSEEIPPLIAEKEAAITTATSVPSSASVQEEEDEEEDGEMHDTMAAEPSFPSRTTPAKLVEPELHRTKSFFRSCQDLQRSEQSRLRDQQRREEELMRRMHQLLLESRAHVQHEQMVAWQEQQTELNAHHQQMQSEQAHLLRDLQEQLRDQQQRHNLHQQELESQRQQQDDHQQQRAEDMATMQREVDQKLESFNSLVAAAQATHQHEIARVTQLVNDLDSRFVSPGALEAAGAAWIQTAAENCIYGANPTTLAKLQQDLLSFQAQLSSQPVVSPAISSLEEAVDRVVQLVRRTTTPGGPGLQGSEGQNAMYSLRQLLAKVDKLLQAAHAEHDGLSLSGVEFLTDAIRRMELGTANLLDAVDFQQEQHQQTFGQHQAGLEKLQKELWRQQQVEKTLRTQLSACPSQEETLKLVQGLKDQINASTAESTSRMLDTVEDLRYRMAGLPSTHTLDQLALDLHAKTDRITHELDTTAGRLAKDLRLKADRAEIDRLQSLLEASNSKAPPVYLSKSPLRCLSCDQHLPFAQAPADGSTTPGATAEMQHPGSPTSHRPDSPPRSPPGSPYRYPIHEQSYHPPQYHHGIQQQAAHTHPHEPMADMGLLEELFAASASALERRRRQRQRLQLQLASTQVSFAGTSRDNSWAAWKPSFVNLDDGRNRIPLRKTLLSDQVIYGPAITPHAFRKKQQLRADEERTARPKTAALPERRPGGEVITRTSSSTVIVRPFAELINTEKRPKK